jgi:large subunit ribosomal protein L30
MSLSRFLQPARQAIRTTSARCTRTPCARYFSADQALDLNSAPPSASSHASSSTDFVSASDTASASTSTDPTHFLVTLKRSSIGLPKQTSGTLEALGLGKKLHRSVLHPFSADVAGQILAVKELVQVRNVTEEEGLSIVTGQGKNGEKRGWDVVGKAPGNVRS